MKKQIAKWTFALIFGNAFIANAADMQLRIGTLAPKNSLYHRQLMDIGEAWRRVFSNPGMSLKGPEFR
jgi:hypothetical protein